MKKNYLLLILSINILTFISCDKSIVEPTTDLVLADEQPQATGKVEFYNHIGNQGPIQLYVDGSYAAYLPNYFTNNTFFDCGFSTNALTTYSKANLSEGSHYYSVTNSGGVTIINNYFYINRGSCTSINLFY